MASEVRFSFSAAGLTLTLIMSGAMARAQSDVQDLPNMGQQITPLAPLGSRFEPLNPDLPYDPAFWRPGLAGRASGHHRGESGSQDPAGSDQRVQPRLQHQRPAASVMVPPGLERVRVHLRHFDAGAGQEASSADPQYLQRDCLRSIRHAFLRGRRPQRQYPHR